MAVHRVLVQRNQHVNLVAHVAHRPVTRANREERVPAADDGLVGIVRVEIEPAPREDARENVAWCGYTLPSLPSDPDCKIHCCHISTPIFRRDDECLRTALMELPTNYRS